MKNLIFLVLINIFFLCCDTQKKIIEKEKQWDVLVFDNEINFLLKENNYNKTAYKDYKHLVIFQKWRGYGGGNFNKEYSFYKGKDTMVVKCECDQEQNIYFKNLKFKKGVFKLEYIDGNVKQNVRGSEIQTSKQLQNMKIINTYKWWETESNFKTIDFKSILFFQIDLNDKSNVKLTEIKLSTNTLSPKD